MMLAALEFLVRGRAQRVPLRNQIIPPAPHRLLETGRRGEENVRLAGLDLLQRSDVEVGQLGELFLGVRPSALNVAG